MRCLCLPLPEFGTDRCADSSGPIWGGRQGEAEPLRAAAAAVVPGARGTAATDAATTPAKKASTSAPAFAQSATKPARPGGRGVPNGGPRARKGAQPLLLPGQTSLLGFMPSAAVAAGEPPAADQTKEDTAEEEEDIVVVLTDTSPPAAIPSPSKRPRPSPLRPQASTPACRREEEKEEEEDVVVVVSPASDKEGETGRQHGGAGTAAKTPATARGVRRSLGGWGSLASPPAATATLAPGKTTPGPSPVILVGEDSFDVDVVSDGGSPGSIGPDPSFQTPLASVPGPGRVLRVSAYSEILPSEGDEGPFGAV